MKLEYFYNSIQLFGVLLGLIGIYIVFKIQSLDARISSYRNNLLISIAIYKAAKDKVQCEEDKAKGIDDEHCKMTYVELVFYRFLVVNGSMDYDLKNQAEKIIDDKESFGKTIGNLPKEYLSGTLGKWIDRKKEKEKIISSIKFPIMLMAGIILFGLFIIINNSFEPVNSISKVSFISIVILLFIGITFLSIIYLSIYILKNLPHE